MKHRVLIFIGLGVAFGLAGTRVCAQLAGSVRGLVTDSDFNDAPLGGVRVQIVQTEQFVLTNEQGNFLIPDVPPGTYTLLFAKDGFTRLVESEVLVNAGQLTEVNASMAGEFTEMDPFVVQELKLDAGSEIGLIELRLETPAFLDSVGEEQLSAAGVGDAAAALSLVSGATVNDDKAVIRGLPDRYVNSQVNGVRFPSADAETRSLELDQFPTAVIESIQVSKTFTPDQQGDASGGAVNIVLKGIPDEDIFEIGVGTSYNTQLTGRDDFLTYRGGGTSFSGIDKGRRQLPTTNPAPVELGTVRGSAPVDYSFDLTFGKRYELDSGWIVGGVANGFYDHGGSFDDDGIDAEYSAHFLDPDGAPVPDTILPSPPFPPGTIIPGSANPRPGQYFFLPDVSGSNAMSTTEPRTSNVFDIVRGSEEVQWGGLIALGAENEFNTLDFIFLQTRTTRDTAITATDTKTRGIIDDQITELEGQAAEPLIGSIGRGDAAGSDLAFVRNQTIQYQERLIRSFQLKGSHTLTFVEPVELGSDGEWLLKSPEIDWTFAISSSQLREPDQRFFQSLYNPDSVSQDVFANNFDASLTGYAQRSWETITEDSDQYQVNLKFPVQFPNNEEGSLKIGLFDDAVTREFDRETFTTENGVQVPPTATLPGGVDFTDFFLTDLLTDPERSVNFADVTNDVDFTGNYDITAFYWMLDVPVTAKLRVIGGLRFETTEIGIGLTNIDDEARAVSPDGTVADPLLDPGGNRILDPVTGLLRGDVDFKQDDILPSLTFIYEATEELSFRAAYSQTLARMTFRELSPIRQQEFLGSQQFFGNQTLRISSVTNYDFRADYRPTPGGLISFSLFYKDIEDPIEYINAFNVSFGTITVPVNFSEGELFGAEIELRQNMEEYFPELLGLSLGANATIIESEVQVSDGQETVPIGQTSRPMLNAPEFLINLFAVYNNEETGTEVGLFYTVRGDTLVSGASAAIGPTAPFTPNIFETTYDTLNFTIAQKLGNHFKLKFSAKNLTNPEIERVYRSPITPDVVNSSFSRGIDFSVSLTAQFEF